MDENLKNQIKTQMKKAFWDLIKSDLESEPQKFEHLIILIEEIKQRLINLTPRNEELKKDINESIDLEFLKELFENKAFESKEFSNLIMYLIHKLEIYCAPARDKDISKFKTDTLDKFKDTVVYSEFLPWFFTEYHSHLDTIAQDISNFKKLVLQKT